MSPGRAAAAERTRARILAAARELFEARGFTAMTMQQVAERAGVALDTVYATVGKKPTLVEALIESAISNSEHAVPAGQRSYVQGIQAEPRAAYKLTLYARAVAQIHARLAPIVRGVQEAARASPELAEVWARISKRRAENMKRFAAELLATGALRPDLDVARVADVLWGLGAPELFDLFVHGRGWSPGEFSDWLADAWARLLLA